MSNSFVGGGAIEIQPHLATVLDTALRAKDINEAAKDPDRARHGGHAAQSAEKLRKIK